MCERSNLIFFVVTTTVVLGKGFWVVVILRLDGSGFYGSLVIEPGSSFLIFSRCASLALVTIMTKGGDDLDSTFRPVQDTAICDNCDEMIPPEDRICPGCDAERSAKVRIVEENAPRTGTLSEF